MGSCGSKIDKLERLGDQITHLWNGWDTNGVVETKKYLTLQEDISILLYNGKDLKKAIPFLQDLIEYAKNSEVDKVKSMLEEKGHDKEFVDKAWEVLKILKYRYMNDDSYTKGESYHGVPMRF